MIQNMTVMTSPQKLKANSSCHKLWPRRPTRRSPQSWPCKLPNRNTKKKSHIATSKIYWALPRAYISGGVPLHRHFLSTKILCKTHELILLGVFTPHPVTFHIVSYLCPFLLSPEVAIMSQSEPLGGLFWDSHLRTIRGQEALTLQPGKLLHRSRNLWLTQFQVIVKFGP